MDLVVVVLFLLMIYIFKVLKELAYMAAAVQMAVSEKTERMLQITRLQAEVVKMVKMEVMGYLRLFVII